MKKLAEDALAIYRGSDGQQAKSQSVPLQKLVPFAGGAGQAVHWLSWGRQPTPGLIVMHTPPHR